MATLNQTYVTLADIAARLDPDNSIASIIEMMNETNEVLLDIPWIEGNLPTGHQTTQRANIPAPTWRMYNQGVSPTKSGTVQITDTCGMLENRSSVDIDLLELNNWSMQFRLSEDAAIVEGFNQEICESIFYGNGYTSPEEFHGLTARFSSSTTGVTAGNVISAGGSGSTNTSIWLVAWGPRTVHGIYPQGSTAGLSWRDLGEQRVLDTDGKPYQAMETLFKWKPGLTVRDWRYIVRICNIDVTTLTTNASSGANLPELMTQAIEKLQSLGVGRPVFYMNRTAKSYLRQQITNANNVRIQPSEVAGKHVLVFDEYPVRRCDQIINTEAAA